MDKAIIDHFQRVDPILHGILLKLTGKTERLTPTSTIDYFSDLCEAIINQQLSEKAGSTIFNRFLDLLPKRKATPKFVLAIDEKKLRGVGMSWSKVRFIRSLAESFQKKTIDFVDLQTKMDDEVIQTLTELHGIGPWTAEMFLMFSLGRPDVFPTRDVGLRRAIQKLYKLKKSPTIRQMERLSKKWSPYRTYACRILWRSLDLSDTLQ